MRKFLVFDADRSLATIGGPEEQKKVFGIQPVTISRGVPQIEAYVARLVEKEMRPVQHELAVIFGMNGAEAEASEPVFVLNKAARSFGIDGIVIDTISTIGQQTREAIMKEKKVQTMDQKLWGIYGDKMQRFIHLLSRMDFPIIVTCHVNRSQDEDGGPMDYPDIKGATKETIARFFDVIAYTRVDRDQRGNVNYTWQVRPDPRRLYAKDRLNGSEAFVEQNITPFLEAYERAGLPLKMLIIGDAGQGKTTSLTTINGKEVNRREES